MTRPSYEESDKVEHKAFIESRSNILDKSFVAEIWIRVINRAISDIILYETLSKQNKKIAQNVSDNRESAVGFIFDDDYMIPIDDYLIDIICKKCHQTETRYISTIAGQDFLCLNCGTRTNKKYVSYIITEEQKIKEITLSEILSLWGVSDINVFRKGVERKIETAVRSKIKNQNNK